MSLLNTYRPTISAPPKNLKLLNIIEKALGGGGGDSADQVVAQLRITVGWSDYLTRLYSSSDELQERTLKAVRLLRTHGLFSETTYAFWKPLFVRPVFKRLRDQQTKRMHTRIQEEDLTDPPLTDLVMSTYCCKVYICTYADLDAISLSDPLLYVKCVKCACGKSAMCYMCSPQCSVCFAFMCTECVHSHECNSVS
jgi:hypothetical protein